MTTVYRPEFEAALRMFARISATMMAQGYEPPILVGGAAVELYSTGTITTGDFDVVTARQIVFEEALRSHGFVKPSGPGLATRGWVHPDLGLGFEVVSAALLGGLAERDRVRLIDMGDDGSAVIISIEDMIADRMGQFMLDQARVLLLLHNTVDRAYLMRRIAEETLGDCTIDDIEGHPF